MSQTVRFTITLTTLGFSSSSKFVGQNTLHVQDIEYLLDNMTEKK